MAGRCWCESQCLPSCSEREIHLAKTIKSLKYSCCSFQIWLRSSQVMGRGGSVQIAVVDAGKISLARKDQPEAKDFAEVAKELLYDELFT